MDDGDFTSGLMLDTSQDAAMDIDFMELFLGGCWVETTEQYNNLQSGSGTLNTELNFLPPLGTNSNRLALETNQMPYDEEAETLNLWGNPPPVFSQTLTSCSQPDNFHIEGNEMNKGCWLAPVPTVDSAASLNVKMRLLQAIKLLRESTKDRNALIQIWVPEKREGKKVLTTTDQPFSVGPDCKSLESYRNVSEKYQFPAEEDSKVSIGLPGRVYLNKMHEWTPDVRLFKSTEYPRIGYAHQYNVQGSLALPVFDRGNGNCLGVVEIVTTTQKMNYKSDLEQIRKALEAFDLRSSEICCPSNIKACNDLYHPALPEIVEILTSVCRTHRLPLAQTWAPCLQHDNGKSLNTNGNHARCVSILDSAFYAADPQILEFHEACSDHNLYESQGVVGQALIADEPCFESNVTACTKTEYPLSHHAKMFNLHAAVAVRLRSVYTGSAEFVLEFFLPTECQSVEEQRQMCSALSYSLQRAGKNLRSLTGTMLKEDVLLPTKRAVAASNGKHGEEETKCSPTKEFSQENLSWFSNMGSQQKGKGVSVSLAFEKKEPQEEFKVTTHWNKFQNWPSHSQVFHDFGTSQQDSVGKGFIENGGGDTSSMSAQCSSGSRKTGEKRRTKTEKTISLQVLRQYFAGSLKDAAKSIGVCPTTLKRICRQHGITRWPSRKIKKVGHSLRKIQLVIDSVQGAEGALQIGNFYSSYPELNSPNLSGAAAPTFSSLKMPLPDQLVQSNLHQHNQTLFSLGGTSSKSPSSSCSQSSGSSLCCSTGANLQSAAANELLAEEQLVGGLKRARSDAELHIPKQEETVVLARAQSHKSLGHHHHNNILVDILPSLAKNGKKKGNAYKVKATLGEEKVRFSLQDHWVYSDLQEEIARRFNLEDVSRMDIKYLDDDSEWVLLTCDADLEECIEISKTCSKGQTIKLSVHLASQPSLGSSLGRIGRGNR